MTFSTKVDLSGGEEIALTVVMQASYPDNRSALQSAYDAADSDVARQVGDRQWYDLSVPTWFVAGNDEEFDTVEALRAGESPARLLRPVPRCGPPVTRYRASRATFPCDARRYHVSEETGRRNLRMPDDDELFAVVTEHNGGNHVRVQCEDGENRMGRIPGRMKYRTWINEGDVVLVEPWDWQDEKANIEWRYTGQDADQLRREGHID